MADLAIDFYGLTPSYSESYLRLNTRRGDDTDVSNKRVYSSGLIFGDYEYYIGLTGGDGPTYSSADYLFVDPIPQNTLITEKSTGFNTGPNGSIDSKYFVNVGDGNVLHGTKTSLVVGNNNETGIGTQNVVILGGLGVSVTASNTVYAQDVNISNSIINRVLLVEEYAAFNGPFTSTTSSILKANTMRNARDQVTIDWWFNGIITTAVGVTFSFNFLSATTGTNISVSIPGPNAFEINVKNEILRTTGPTTPGFHTAQSRVTITKKLGSTSSIDFLGAGNMILLNFTNDLPITYTITGGAAGDTIQQRSYTQEYKGAPIQ